MIIGIRVRILLYQDETLGIDLDVVIVLEVVVVQINIEVVKIVVSWREAVKDTIV